MTHTITRSTTFDSGHRVMNERMKCFNLHGHTYRAHVTWACNDKAAIGYAIDFKEIKRVHMQWIDDYLDHGFIANPHDYKVIETVKQLENKLFLMSLNGKGQYCNPSAENIALEMFYCLDHMTECGPNRMIKLDKIELWETPNCMVTVNSDDASRTPDLQYNVLEAHSVELQRYIESKGVVQYDDRLV